VILPSCGSRAAREPERQGCCRWSIFRRMAWKGRKTKKANISYLRIQLDVPSSPSFSAMMEMEL